MLPYSDPQKAAAVRAAWHKRHPEKRKLVNKLAWIKRQFGQPAKDYFIAHPVCERCGEKRLGCLHIHHVNGKAHDDFETLCANCHAVEHYGEWTYEDCGGKVAAPSGVV